MKFGYRDRIVLLVACVIIIFGVGIIVFIKPKYQDLQKNKKSRDKLQQEWSIQLDKFNAINSRQEKIEKDFKTATDVASNFTDEMDGVGLDNFLREKFANTEQHIKDGMKLTDSLSVTDETTGTLNYYYYTPSVVTYPLFEAADMDGSLATALAEKRKESDVLSSRASQTVGAGNASFVVTINREDAFALIDAVHDYAVKNKDTMIINSVMISDYKFLQGLTEEQIADLATKKAAATPSETPAENDEEEVKGTANVAISYTVYYMQEPMKPELGEKYDETVWDTDAWRSYGSAEKTAE